MKLKTSHKLKAFNLQEILIVLAIIGILLLLALPNLMPYIAKTKAIEAQIQLKSLYTAQTQYRYLYARYSDNFNEIDFEAPITSDKGGTARYRYEITEATSTSFKARAEAVEDFDGDGTFNVWEIDKAGKPQEIIPD